MNRTDIGIRWVFLPCDPAVAEIDQDTYDKYVKTLDTELLRVEGTPIEWGIEPVDMITVLSAGGMAGDDQMIWAKKMVTAGLKQITNLPDDIPPLRLIRSSAGSSVDQSWYRDSVLPGQQLLELAILIHQISTAGADVEKKLHAWSGQTSGADTARAGAARPGSEKPSDATDDPRQ